jgi:RNA methyltransferase, TrmH family
MLTKATLRFLTDLQQRKHRLAAERFVVEGAKSVIELLESGLRTERVYGTRAFLVENDWLLRRTGVPAEEATSEELVRVGSLVTNDAAIAVAELPAVAAFSGAHLPLDALTLALADVRDPGNVGTIIRLADWYGVAAVVCSPTTADPFSPKAVSASMGSIFRVSVVVADLPEMLATLPSGFPAVWGADLSGADVHSLALEPVGLLVLGSESHGLPPDVAAGLTARLHIPRRGRAESLNVAMATAILLDNFYRSH